ncbi:signal recognition particle [Virgisporangium aurantiacum]|uniref:pPIWI-RE three-gene island domain-containing protein n=1 Tax=Virgisporangium aurantiacum TaxID=175570 RepID=A0A8J4E9F2_9ACTN|nr:signal recognition particle [Virgisporangium aurantiacum]GIJ63672.1 hypothetical protein Vau01_111880 [Virgisporangium aurantiacum]
MRSRNQWHRGLTELLRPTWPATLQSFTPGDLLNVEFGLYLLETVMPGRPAADAWTLFGGYPYGEAFGDVRTEEQRLMVRRARHYMWSLRRRRVWHSAIRDYQAVPRDLRGYDVKDVDTIPDRLTPARADERFDRYRELLTSPPMFERSTLPIAGTGEHWFPVRDRTYSVTFGDLAHGPAASRHDLTMPPVTNGEAITVNYTELEHAAEAMDRIEAANPDTKANSWLKRLRRVELLSRSEGTERFEPGQKLAIHQILHMVGMVGAGKSTLRDILAFVCADRQMKITIVVGDVAEALNIVGVFNTLGVRAAPILGHSTRERHIQRLHRRLATAGAANMLSHEHAGFAFVNSACPVDALRGLEADRPLRIREAPCAQLYPATKRDDTSGVMNDEHGESSARGRKAERHGCPLWARCPRHHGARELVDAAIWVATPASLIHSAVPAHQIDERMRYLELACQRSDLIIVDEADRVQMQLDTAFAPATTLVGRGQDSWLDEVHSHKITELVRLGRLQLSQQFIDDWINALNTVSTAADRLYGMLTRSKSLRHWIVADYFSAHTLHHWLLNTWFPDLAIDSADDLFHDTGLATDERARRRDHVSDILDRFRDQPLQPADADPSDTVTSTANELVALTLELLHSQSDRTRDRLRTTLLGLVEHDPAIEARIEQHAMQFEFTLVLAALHHRLDFMTMLWPRVEAALNLDATSNVLSRRPPKDYEPIIPESPMGNVLGFQFQLDDQVQEPGLTDARSGSLRFFRCNGLGRDLLLNLHEMPNVDDRPGPAVLLMSATSWAGTSSRYHIHHPVGAVLRPHKDEVDAILKTTFRKEFLYADGAGQVALQLSGTNPDLRPRVLTQMLRLLAEADPSLAGSTSKLADELADITDPDRRRILLLVGSYAESKRAASYLNAIPEWNGRVTVLVSDDADLDDAWQTLPRDPTVRTLRRGDVASFANAGGEILVAPLLAVERGHNIVLTGGKAAIGTVYFLARPHPRPDDIALAIQSVNDWAVRYVRSGNFRQMALACGTPDAAGREFRRRARHTWQRFLTRRLSWGSLPDDEKLAFTWDQLVVMWQVIGRLVRGGVPARVVFVDAAFAPREAGMQAEDTAETSLLLSMHNALHYYLSHVSNAEPVDQSLVRALYQPLYQALDTIDL